jgi:hypothetical protein
MAPPVARKPAEDVVLVQELGSGATEGSRKRRKSIVTTPTKANASPSPKKITGVHVNGAPTVNGSPKARKSSAIVGSPEILVVGN